MINFDEWWLPDGETHLQEWMRQRNERVGGRLTYQYHKLQAALKYCVTRRVAVDVGAHVGLWSYYLVKEFGFVHAFEPIAAHRECFEKNLEGRAMDDVMLYPCALGEVPSSVSLYTAPTSSGDSWIEGRGPIPMQTLDEFDLQEVDFIKLDCEGYELLALRGGEETLRSWQPVICVEQKPGKAQKFGLGEKDAIKYLEDLGATVREEISGDYILTF